MTSASPLLSVEIEAEAIALSLRGDQAIADFIAHTVDNATRVLATENLNTLDLYRKGDITAYARFYLRGANRKFCLSFVAIPPGAERPVSLFQNYSASERDRGIGEIERNQCQMFLGVGNFVESPEGVIPSLVRLEPFKDRADFRWQILASAGQIVAPISFGWTKRKLDGLEGGAFCGDSGCISSLVEDRTQIAGNVEENTWQEFRHLCDVFHFVDVFSGTRVLINEEGPCVVTDQSINYGLEVLDVMLCPTERDQAENAGVPVRSGTRKFGPEAKP